MRIMRLVFSRIALALAGTLVVGVADTAFAAQAKKPAGAASAQANPNREASRYQNIDRQLEGRLYRSYRHKNHRTKKEKNDQDTT